MPPLKNSIVSRCVPSLNFRYVSPAIDRPRWLPVAERAASVRFQEFGGRGLHSARPSPGRAWRSATPTELTALTSSSAGGWLSRRSSRRCSSCVNNSLYYLQTSTMSTKTKPASGSDSGAGSSTTHRNRRKVEARTARLNRLLGTDDSLEDIQAICRAAFEKSDEANPEESDSGDDSEAEAKSWFSEVDNTDEEEEEDEEEEVSGASKSGGIYSPDFAAFDDENPEEVKKQLAREYGTIGVYDEQDMYKLDTKAIEAKLKKAMEVLGCQSWDVTLDLTTDEKVKELNSQYRGVDKPTDILSFPSRDFSQKPGVVPKCTHHFQMDMGDMYVALPYVDRQMSRDRREYMRAKRAGEDWEEIEGISPERGVSGAMAEVFDLQERVCLLAVHGLIHLLGYDHMTDEDYEAMVAVEEKVLKAI